MNPARTASRGTFDVIFGMIVPVVCLFLDPGVYLPPADLFGGFIGRNMAFRCGSPQMGNSAAYFVYPVVGISILSLLYWLIRGHRLPQWAAFFSGILGAGAVSAIVFGMPLLFFGFPAWLAAFVYGRNAKTAWEFADPTNDRLKRILLAVGGVVLLLSLAGIAYLLLRVLLPPIVLPACPDV